MARPESTHYELTETERRDIIKLIEQSRCDTGTLYKVKCCGNW